MSPAPSSSPKKRAAPRRISRDVVIAAAIDVFSAKGFHGASIRDIANAAETSLSNIYNYFPSKADLLAELLATTSEDLAARLSEAVARAGDRPTEQLVAAVGEYVAFIVDRPKSSIVGISEIRYLDADRRAEVVSHRDKTEAIFLSVIVAGVDDGSFRPTDVKATARAVVTLCNSMSNWYRADGPLGPDELARQQSELCLALVRAHEG